MDIMVQTNDLINSESSPDPQTPIRRGRPRNGSEAEGRARLLDSAMDMFAEKGLNGVSTRELATAAGVNLSAITYHFGGKKGLYEAAIRHALAELAPRRKRVIETLGRAVEAAGRDKAALALVAAGFVRAFFTALTSTDFPMAPVKLVVRELHHPTAAFSLVMDGHINPAQDAITGLVAAATGGEMNDAEVKLLGLSVTAQVMKLSLMRPVILSRMGWEEYSPENAETLVAATVKSVLRLLNLPTPDTTAGP